MTLLRWLGANMIAALIGLEIHDGMWAAAAFTFCLLLILRFVDSIIKSLDEPEEEPPS